MDDELRTRFASLTTAHLADACLRAAVQVRCAPPQLTAVLPGSRVVGPVCPARHAGSVDVFLEALESASRGDVLVVDNAGRLDEACVGDLVIDELRSAGLAGAVIWGLHRDSDDLVRLGLPVFSLGAFPSGPQRLDPRPPGALTGAEVGQWTVGGADVVFGDADGVIFLPARCCAELVVIAERIRDTERRQAELIREGTPLRAQLRFSDYLAARQETPTFSFRDHLRALGGAIEE